MCLHFGYAAAEGDKKIPLQAISHILEKTFSQHSSVEDDYHAMEINFLRDYVDLVSCANIL